MKHLYCWNQQKSSGSVDDAAINEISNKITEIEERLGVQFKFEDVKLEANQKISDVVTNPDVNTIYIVENSNTSEEDKYDEYIYRIKDGETSGSFELVGSGSYAQFQAHVDKFTKHIDNQTQNGIHVTSNEKNTWNNKQDKLTIEKSILNTNNPIASSVIYALQNNLNNKISSTNNKIETIKTQIPVGECEETDNTIDKKSFAIGNCSYVGISTRNEHYANEIESGVAIGNAATATRNGEISICGSLFNRSDDSWSKVELLIGTGQDEYLFGNKSGDYGDGTYVTDKPYLEIRVSDQVGCGNPGNGCWNSRVESVKIPIKKVFDILMEYSGVYKNEGFDEGEYWDEEEENGGDDNAGTHEEAQIITGGPYIPDASKWSEEQLAGNTLSQKIIEVVDGVAYGEE